MSITKVLARHFKLEINIGTEATPSWLKVNGLETLTFSSTKTDVETDDFDSAGLDEHMVVGRGRSMGIEGYYLVDLDTGDRDPGQEAVETAAELIGEDSLAQFKLTYPGGAVKTFYASVNLKDMGGAKKAKAGWGADLTVSGSLADAV